MRSFPSSILNRLAGACAAAGLLVAWNLRADIDLPSVPPAQPEPATAKVFVGESVEIPLKGVSRSGLPLQFIIRRQPAAGKLSAITPTSRNTATVTYTHDASAGPGADRFRYAVRAPYGGVSTPAEVLLNVVERPPVFVAPARLEFPDVPVGESERKTFEIRNDGGSRLEGRLTVPAPWKIAAGDGGYSLGPGGSATLAVTFTPTDSRQFAGTGEFSHAPGVEIGLGGRGYAPIEVVPREVRVEGDGRGEVRTGGFLLRNVSDTDRELTIAAPTEVIIQDKVNLAAKSECQVALHTRAGFLGALGGRITITGDDVRIEVPLRVMAAPARITAQPKAIDFGSLVAGHFGRVKVTLHNAGGTPAELRVTAPEGVLLQPDPSYEALAPGAVREIEVAFARPAAGRLDDAVSFDAGNVPLLLPVRAVVIEDPRSAPDAAPTGASRAAAPAIQPASDIPPVEQIGVSRQTKTELDLTWKRTSPSAVRYAVILRRVDFAANGEAVFKYLPLPQVKPRFVRDDVRATIGGLHPGESITILIVGFDAAGAPSQPSPPFDVFTKPSAVFRIPWIWLGLVAVAGLAVVIVRERRRARAAGEAEIERMYRS
ncbi:MAG: choice-of-anchor D domain-containing protein [Terrimicrobiaceae bacterium]|nr:choice-of-anchor D domain-containing protein [Terrimicrobiaceae bacterium]